MHVPGQPPIGLAHGPNHNILQYVTTSPSKYCGFEVTVYGSVPTVFAAISAHLLHPITVHKEIEYGRVDDREHPAVKDYQSTSYQYEHKHVKEYNACLLETEDPTPSVAIERSS